MSEQVRKGICEDILGDDTQISRDIAFTSLTVRCSWHCSKLWSHAPHWGTAKSTCNPHFPYQSYTHQSRRRMARDSWSTWQIWSVRTIIKVQIFTMIQNHSWSKYRNSRLQRKCGSYVPTRRSTDFVVDICCHIYQLKCKMSHKSVHTWKPLQRCRSNLQEWMQDLMALTLLQSSLITSEVVSASHQCHFHVSNSWTSHPVPIKSLIVYWTSSKWLGIKNGNSSQWNALTTTSGHGSHTTSVAVTYAETWPHGCECWKCSQKGIFIRTASPRRKDRLSLVRQRHGKTVTVW